MPNGQPGNMSWPVMRKKFEGLHHYDITGLRVAPVDPDMGTNREVDSGNPGLPPCAADDRPRWGVRISAFPFQSVPGQAS